MGAESCWSFLGGLDNELCNFGIVHKKNPAGLPGRVQALKLNLVASHLSIKDTGRTEVYHSCRTLNL
jgi:hypothetical protein